MRHAFSLTKNKLISTDEFVAMKGDHGQLIGRNLIVCAECRSNVTFVKPSIDGRRAAHFKHEKFRENSKACQLRIGQYTEERVRRINENRKRYGVGYFQQRAEDYISLSVIKSLKDHGLNAIDVSLNSSLELDIEVFEAEGSEARILHFLRKKIATEVRMSRIDARINPYLEGIRALLSWLIDESPSLDFIRDNVFDIGIWRNFKNDANEDNLSYAIELAKHLRHGHTNRILLALKEASGYLSTCALIDRVSQFKSSNVADSSPTVIDPQKATNKAITCDDLLSYSLDYPLSGSVYEQFSHILDLYATGSYLGLCIDEKKLNKAEDRNPYFLFDSSLEAAMNKSYYGIYPELREHPIFKLLLQAPNPIEAWKQHNRNANIRCLLSIDLPSVLADFYGDDAGSYSELQLKSYDAKRGYIYIAYSTGFNGLWLHELKKLNRRDCVKIGYSLDPERRKNEIAGNIAPPDSVVIEGVFYVYDMKKGEKYVHHALRSQRLSNSREMFAIDVCDAYEKVEKLVDEFNSASPSVTKSKKTMQSGMGFSS